MRNYIFLVTIFIMSTPYSAHAYGTFKETYCAQAFGFSTLDEMKKDLLLNAKRLAVNELFGELITASTSVENLILTSDQIRTSSIGFVRLEGDLAYSHGKNLGEVCVQATAYATEEDREKFKPVNVTKRACATDLGSSARDLKILAEKNAITTALVEYERRLSELDEDVLLRLMRQVTFSESGFVPETETYCTRAAGIVYPIDIIASTFALTQEDGVAGGKKVYNVNLALSKEAVAASIQGDRYQASYATDGNTSTRWSTVFADPQWIIIDLEKSYLIDTVILKWERASGKKYQIQVSTNNKTWKEVYATTTGAGGTEKINFKPNSARYVRLDGAERNTGFGYSLWEFEVYLNGKL